MSTTAPIKIAPAASARPLPLVIYFEGDELAKRTLSGLQRYRRISFEALESAPHDVEHIVVMTRDAQMDAQRITAAAVIRNILASPGDPLDAWTWRMFRRPI